MEKIRVFISSVQKEFVEERQALYKHFSDNALLNNFFEPVMFEKLAAASKAPDKVYLKEVENSQLYLMMLGAEYGYEDKNGLSPTEIEYNHAQSLNKDSLAFIKGKGTLNRHDKENILISKIQNTLSYKRFKTIDELISEVDKACVALLKNKGLIQLKNFDETFCPSANLSDIDQDISQATDQAEDLIKRLVIVLDKELGRREIMNLLDLRHGQNFRENYLFPALKLGYIEMTLLDKPTSPKQQYRLTKKGKALKKMLED